MANRISYSINEFAKMNGLGRETIIRRIKDPIDPLPVRRFGRSGKYMIFMSDFEKWLERQPSNL